MSHLFFAIKSALRTIIKISCSFVSPLKADHETASRISLPQKHSTVMMRRLGAPFFVRGYDECQLLMFRRINELPAATWLACRRHWLAEY